MSRSAPPRVKAHPSPQAKSETASAQEDADDLAEGRRAREEFRAKLNEAEVKPGERYKAPVPPKVGWTLNEAAGAIFGGPTAWKDFGPVVDVTLLLGHMKRRPDLSFAGRAPGATERQVIPSDIYDSGATIEVDALAGTLRISFPSFPERQPTHLVDVRIVQSVKRKLSQPEADAAAKEDALRNLDEDGRPTLTMVQLKDRLRGWTTLKIAARAVAKAKDAGLTPGRGRRKRKNPLMPRLGAATSK